MIRINKYISLVFLLAGFGVIGCNPGIVDVPTPPVSDAASYFWHNSGTVVFKDIDSIGAKTTYTLNFTPGNSKSFTVAQSGTSDILTCTVSSDTVGVTGLSTHSIIPLPDGYAIKPLITLIPHKAPTISFKHILAVTSSSIVATGDTGIFYSSDAGTHWKLLSTSFGRTYDAVTELVYIGNMVYAATATGSLYFSTDSGLDWSSKPVGQFKVPISALAIDPSSYSLFISSGDTLYRLGINTQQIVKLSGNQTLHFTSLSFADSILIGGTDQQGLWYRYRDSDWTQVTSVPATAAIKSVLAANQTYYASTSAEIYFSADGERWAKTPLTFPEAFFAYDSFTRFVTAFNSTGSVIQFTSPTSNAISLPLPVTNLHDISIAYPNAFAATDQGIYTGTDKDSAWHPLFGNGGSLPSDTIKKAGDVLLLRSITGTASADSSWQAGTLIQTLTGSTFPFTARIVDHLTSVTMPDSTVYSDVIEVQYSYGQAGTSGIPYLQIFYAKDAGPIIIRVLKGSEVTRKIYRWKN